MQNNVKLSNVFPFSMAPMMVLGMLLPALLIAAPTLRPTFVASSAPKMAEEEVMAGIILNLPFVAAWPASKRSADGNIHICAPQLHAVGREVKKAVDYMGAGSGVVYSAPVPLKQLQYCHIVVMDGEAKTADAVIRYLQNVPVVTVGTSRGFAKRGGMIGFTHAEKNLGLFADSNVRFEVNLNRAKHVRVSLDPQLLELAEKVLVD